MRYPEQRPYIKSHGTEDGAIHAILCVPKDGYTQEYIMSATPNGDKYELELHGNPPVETNLEWVFDGR